MMAFLSEIQTQCGLIGFGISFQVQREVKVKLIRCRNIGISGIFLNDI